MLTECFEMSKEIFGDNTMVEFSEDLEKVGKNECPVNL